MVHPGAKSEASGPEALPKRRKPWGLLLAAGPILLFAAAVSYGVAERHSSTDTWIALATGRYILTEWKVPLVDPFSYTFAGQPWFNQNWLSHVLFYWLYDHISPSAVILGTWVMNAAMFVLVLLAIRVRSRSWLASWIGASFVALGGYGYLSARPASVGFLLLASLMAILSALSAPTLKKRWWPAVLLLPLFGVWGCAHGTFFFGYGLVGLFVGCWFLTWIVKAAATPPAARHAALRAALTARQVALVVAVSAVAAVLTIIFGPYGFENFTHPLKVATSDVFRTVNEWKPPYQYAKYPPVWAFWASLGVALFSLAVAFVTWLLTLALRETGKARRGRKRLEPDAPCISLFDVAAVLLGLYMALWARRFAPLFYILAAPTIVTAVVLLTAHASELTRRYCRIGLLAASWLGALSVGGVSAWKVYDDFVAPYRTRPEMDLLERAVLYERVPHLAIEFLSRNDLPVNLMTEWTQAGVVMLQARNVKVFIDGRSQQVYDERHYRNYQGIMLREGLYVREALVLLDQCGTNALLLRGPLGLMQAVERSPAWKPVMYHGPWALFLHAGSPVFGQLAQLERSGRAWWPVSAQAEAGRASLWQVVNPPDYDRALRHYRAAVDRQGALGLTCYVDMTRLWIRQGRPEEAAAYFRQQVHRLRASRGAMDENLRRALLERIAKCMQMLREAELPPPG